MAVKNILFDLKRTEFQDTSFNLLMQKRIYKVLLICSSYDSFMLEEDGRIDEQIFNEYVSLNLRYPPVFLQANSEEEALEKLDRDNIDLVINMLSVSNVDAFYLANKIKASYPKVPIVILTPFSREVSLKLEKVDLSSIDYVFCWLGNADILLAIIKLIEDKMNSPKDIDQIGVQAIILVEDSIRYYSSYLPSLYKVVLQQSKRSMVEGVNEHQRMLRMRGRPKILLATNYEEALNLYSKYKKNILGIISDIAYQREGKKDQQAGILLCKTILEEDPHMPFILQSSDNENYEKAKELNVAFIHKYSKSLLVELRNFVIQRMAFGDFIFRLPGSLQEINRATSLKSLQEKILKIPDESLLYHINRNDFSKWMNARALFQIAQEFKYLTPEHFNNLEEVRAFIFDIISDYRLSKGRGVIAKFDRNTFDDYLIFSRIGDGSLGGKARGLAFIDSLIKKYQLLNKFEDVLITIPRTVVLSSEVFDEFMEANDLYKVGLSDKSDEEILETFVSYKLPGKIHQDLYKLISVIRNPIAIRSSSKLEDSHYQPFAGIYSTYMVPNDESNPQLMVKLLTDAIKSVYASVFFKSSKAYMAATSNLIDEEKMGIIIQEVCGTAYNGVFMPTFSGVARSVNFYPIKPEKTTDGIANIAFGLGKYIVEGGVSLRFSPKYPKKILQLSSPEMALRDTQKHFFALNLSPDKFTISPDDGVNIEKISIRDSEDLKPLKFVSSSFDLQNNIIRDGANAVGKKIVTFSPILNHNTFPLAEILGELLKIGQKEMNNPIEIEFAVNMDTSNGCPKLFNFLQ
ncbi:MAG: phosphoenolpyruvate synthase, partial [Bacteroidales bacterium]|nr:phosphoenolpyruvate synthase [Bacteroidales bacterium]